jgi:hypothetical protein
MTQPVDQDLMASRYGTRRTSLLLLGSIVLVAVLFVGWVIWAAVQQADPPMQWRTVGVSDVSDTSVTLAFEVDKDPSDAVVCTVRALDASGVEVGRAEVPVTGNQSTTSVVYTLQVTARPASADVIDCQPEPNQ